MTSASTLFSSTSEPDQETLAVVAPTTETPSTIDDEDFFSAQPLNILLVNDDGYQAEGIKVLYEALVAAGHRVTLVAPKQQQSGKGTAIDADKIFQPIEVVNYAENQWYVDGTPVVTTLAGLDYILQDHPPDLVISGINEGENLGYGAISSGTLSAAVIALQKGIPAIAISAGIKLGEASENYPSTQEAYEIGAKYVIDVIAQLQETQAGETLLPEGVGLNVNIPADKVVKGVSYTGFDEATSLALRFGDLPSGGQGLLLTSESLATGEVPDVDSEGEQFLTGRITVTPIDGNWSAEADRREAISDRLGELTIFPVVKPLNILLVNDDGYQAEGIKILYEALVAAGHHVTLVAPKQQQSGKGTSINTEQLFQPIEVINYAENQWYVDSTPVVTTKAGLDYILQDNLPDLVISGINQGENIGLSAVSSGTLSAAVTAVLEDIPSIAVSAGIKLEEAQQDYPSTQKAYRVGAEYIVNLIAQLQATQGEDASILPKGIGLNVNIPAVDDIKGVSVTEFDQATSLGFRFGDLSPTFGEGQGLLLVPGTSSDNPNPISEGEQFLAGYITVTPFDGDWGGNQSDRQLIAADLSQVLFGDADDPAIWVNPDNTEQSLIIATLKDGGLVTFNLDGSVNQDLTVRPYGDERYNNVDLIYGFDLNGKIVDLAIASDRQNDTLVIWAIDPETRQLNEVTAADLSDPTASIFGIDDGEQTAYGVATYTSPSSGDAYVFVSQREGNQIAQLELIANPDGTVSTKIVRTLSAPDNELENPQFEGMVVDQELGDLYAAQEQRGIWKFLAEPNADPTGELIEAVTPEGNVITPDAEGLTIYYGANRTGYLLASSQGDSTFAVFRREGENEYLGSIVIDDGNGIDGVQESDGAAVINIPLGSEFPYGLLVVHDGDNEPAVLVEDDGEIENINTNFKYIDWREFAIAFENPLDIDPISYDPRHPSSDFLITANIVGTDEDDRLFGRKINERLLGEAGNDLLFGYAGNDILLGGEGNDFLNGGKGDDTLSGGDDRDVFVLSLEQSQDVITDFTVGVDLLALSKGLTFSNLAIAQDNNNTIISVADNCDILATLTGVHASTITSGSFITL
ncbi:5'/3'-nucleotidase SurE [Fischerella thermalis]|uniref:5'-nucleotidase n=1 Tax=Fischerella thermalis CCMEE 5318 TaxID=2019666 RepID=A0A2N6LL87_9CYAN|nr:5'/3'-nucleotidase SurE [Fischerella thermalis]PMB25643.1 5'/3'-nucleotidase SurE [Fischerella thermalis CCMEE 5318]